MRPLLLGLFVATSTVLLPVPPAAAQPAVLPAPEPGTWTVTPFLGTSMGISSPAPGNSLGLGAAVAYDWTASLGFEGEFGHLLDVAGDAAAIDWSVTTFSANAVYHFAVERLTPYATFGLGFERSHSEIKEPDPAALVLNPNATEFAFNFGGGVKYPITDRMAVRADLRRFHALDIAPNFWRLYGGLTFRLGR